MRNRLTQSIKLLDAIKGSEHYLFIFTNQQAPNVLRTLGRWASNPELSLTWYDAAVLSQKVRKAVKE